MIWLDNAATSFFKPPSVKAAVSWAFDNCASPGRGGNHPAMEAARAVYYCRELVGELFSCRPEQAVFTCNATHGLNIAINTLVPIGGRVVMSGFEHNAVLRTLYARGAHCMVAGRKIFDPENTLREFENCLVSGADCVVCTHVSNVFGYVLPVEEIGKLCRKKGVPFIVDASQSAGVLPLSCEALNADFIAMPGHKGLYGPQGTGLLLCSRIPSPLIFGGTGTASKDTSMPLELPDRAEAGTHNVPGICGLAAGVRFVLETGTERILRHEMKMIDILRSELGRTNAELFTGSPGSGVLSLRMDGWDCEEMAEYLAMKDISVRAGLHCAPLAHESAGTLDTGTVRFSPSFFSTSDDMKQAAFYILSKQRKNAK